MRVLLTGSHGLVGQKLGVLLAAQKGYTCLATGRGIRRGLPSSMPYEPLDICDKVSVASLFREWRPEAVIHTAAMTDVDLCERSPALCAAQNIGAVEHLVAASEAAHAFFLHFSTDFVFDGKAGPYAEDAAASPVNMYGQSKWCSEQKIVHSKLSWAMIRTSLVYGFVREASRINFVYWVKERLARRETLRLVDDQWRTPSLADDLAYACMRILEKKAQGMFHISGEEVFTPYTMGMAIAQHEKADKTLIQRVSSQDLHQEALRPSYTCLVIDKAKQVLGHRPTSFAAGLALMDAQAATL